MRKEIFYLSVLFVLCSLSVPAQDNDVNSDSFNDLNGALVSHSDFVRQDTGDLIHTIPAPGTHCNELAWDGEAMWVSDIISDSIYRIAYEDGAILRSFPYPMNIDFIEGLDYYNGYLWASGWAESNGTGTKLMKIDPSDGSVVKSLNYPDEYEYPWPHGLAYDGKYLWANNFIYQELNALDKIDPETGELVATVTATADVSVGIEYIGNSLWITTQTPNKIQRLNSATGELIWEIYTPCYDPRGLDWDGEFLWTISWQAETLYQFYVGPAKVENIEKVNQINLFPNPASESLNIKFNTTTAAPVEVTLSSLAGEIVASTSIKIVVPGENLFVWNIENDGINLQNGIYLVTAESNEWKFTRRLIFIR